MNGDRCRACCSRRSGLRLRQRRPAANSRHDLGRPARPLNHGEWRPSAGQAWPVAAEQHRAATGRRRSDHCRRQRRLGRTASEQPDARRSGGGRRRAAVVAVGPLPDGGRLRPELLVDAQRPGGQLRRPDDHRPALWPAGGLRRTAVCAVLRRHESDPHHPDVFGIAQVGTIYTTGSKIAEHGGDNPGDREFPLVVYRRARSSPASRGAAWKRLRSLRRS